MRYGAHEGRVLLFIIDRNVWCLVRREAKTLGELEKGLRMWMRMR